MISPVGVACLCAFAAICCWSVSAMCFEHAGRVVGSMAVNIIRLCFAFIFLGIPLMFMQGSASPVPIELDSTQWIWMFISGLIGFFLSDLFLFRSFVILGPRLATLILSLWPVFCAIIEFAILGKCYHWYQYMGMAVTIAGVTWVVLERRPPDDLDTGDDAHPKNRLTFREISPWGVFCALTGALGQAIGIVCARVVMESADDSVGVALAGTQVRVIAGILGFVVFFTLIRCWPLIFSGLKNRRAVGLIFLGAFFGPSLGMVLMIYALGELDAGIAGTIGALMPLVLIPPAIIINKEHVTPRAFFGAVVAVSGVVILVGNWDYWLGVLYAWFLGWCQWIILFL